VMIPPLNRYVPALSKNELVKTVTNRDIQFTSFNGKDYPLCFLDEKTPLLFQWFERNPARFGKNDIPIINTEKNPYLNNIIKAATIEKERLIGIFVDGDFFPGQKDAFSKLEYDYENIKVIYRNDIDFSMYDKKLSEIYMENISKQESMPEEKRDCHLLQLLKKELSDIQEGNDSLIKSYLLDKGHVWFDFYRNMAMLKAGQLFLEADKAGCYDLSTNSGCIYLDTDMIITEKLGGIYIPDGIAVHVERIDGRASMENGIIAVDRNNHPALLAGLEIMHTKFDADPYSDGVCNGIRKHFNYSLNEDYNSFCDFIEFKHDNIIMNTSQFTQSSWARHVQ
ncbi:TPA: type III secretion system effector arginine glycosyltransferase SseK1, partial [Salmonella enterica subsp. enterica serovar Weltevreden]